MKDHYLGATYDLTQANMNNLIRQLEEAEDKLVKVLKYCKPHTEQMWAASVAGIILECDFRDAGTKIKEIKCLD